MSEPIVVGVTDFIAICNQTLEYAYPSVGIEGEISDYRVSRGKWVYFDLKDEFSSVRCFGTVYQLSGPMEDGMKVRVFGAPRLHNKYGFSITVSQLVAVGEGARQRALQLLREKLAAEGLFDVERKRPIPFAPSHIAVVASAESAAYGDFVKVASARWGGFKLQLINAQVQGQAAVESLVLAMSLASQQACVEVVVVTRGGGSSEDLSAFDDERVARAIASSRVPTVVAVGHERDETMAELVADLRASTPSNAAELLLPSREEQLARVARLRRELQVNLDGFAASEERRLTDLTRRLRMNIDAALELSAERLASLQELLTAYDPNAALARGYSLTRQGGQLARSIHDLDQAQPVFVQMVDGQFEGRITQIQANDSRREIT